MHRKFGQKALTRRELDQLADELTHLRQQAQRVKEWHYREVILRVAGAIWSRAGGGALKGAVYGI